MANVNPMRGEVAFDLFVGAENYSTVKDGDVMLLFTTADLAKIVSENNLSGLPEIAQKVGGENPSVIQSCLYYGLKYTETRKRFIDSRTWLDDLPFPLGYAAAFIGDCLAWQSAGIMGFTGRDWYEARLESSKTGESLDRIFRRKMEERYPDSASAKSEGENGPFASSTGSSQMEPYLA
jgi:hypothetical protein